MTNRYGGAGAPGPDAAGALQYPADVQRLVEAARRLAAVCEGMDDIAPHVRGHTKLVREALAPFTQEQP